MTSTHLPVLHVHMPRTRTNLFRKRSVPAQATQSSANERLVQPVIGQTTKVILSHFSKITNDQKRRHLYAKNELRRRITGGTLETANARRLIPLSFVPSASFGLLNTRSKTKPGPGRGKSGLKAPNFKPGLGYLSFAPALTRYRKKMGSFTRIRNRCVLTSHPSSIGKLGLSRICFRTYAGAGKLPGLFKL